MGETICIISQQSIQFYNYALIRNTAVCAWKIYRIFRQIYSVSSYKSQGSWTKKIFVFEVCVLKREVDATSNCSVVVLHAEVGEHIREAEDECIQV